MLPLRTSVDLFSDAHQPSALTRAKQAAVLHDSLVVEVGFLDVSITDHGGSIWWTPPDQITDEHARRARKPPELGTPMTLAIGPEGALGQPAEKLTAIVSGEISMAYGAEWHSEVLEPLSAIGVDFVETFATGGGDISTFHPIGQEISRQNLRDSSDPSLLPGVNTFQRDFVYKSFNRDAAVAADLDAVLQVSTLFEPMLERRGWEPTGTTALQVAAPNLQALAWEQVLEFRAHPGANEAGEMLREFERLAAEQEPEDSRAFLLKISQEMADGLFAVLEHRSVHVTRAAAEEAAKTAISFIPVIGPFIEKGVTAAELGAAKRAESRSGIAALMKLRGS